MARSRTRRLAALALGPLLVLSVVAATPARADGSTGAVYTLSNDPAGNRVVIFRRAANGSLHAAGSVRTGGLGSGGGLGSQGAIVLSDSGRWLIGVNAGSDELSLFAVSGIGLRRTAVVGSGGDLPISVTVHGNLVYALNDGSDDLVGFRIASYGRLLRIPGSRIGLSGDDVAPAQVEFTPNGRRVVVTEKDTNLIDVYRVRSDGRLSPPNVQASEGATPFGFAFDPSGRLVVSEAFGGAPGASAMSSYTVGLGGTLTTLSASVPDFEAAACWVAITPDGRFAYTTNTGSDTVSGYEIAANGALTLFGGAAFAAGDEPIDMGIARGEFLYTLDAGSHTISAFEIEDDGELEAIAGRAGLPPASVGLAVA